MPSMKTMTRSGALMVMACLGIAGPGRAQDPARAEARARTAQMRAAMEQTEAAMVRSGAAMPQLEMALAQLQARMGGGMGFGSSSAGLSAEAPEPWAQEDPAAKEYQAAREALNGGKYADAAKRFEGLRAAYPSSAYVADSFYWQAFALYRVGGRANLRSALDLLAMQGTRYPKAQTRGDAGELRVQLESQLARQGDANAAAAITRQAADPCQNDEQSVRAAALGALMNMNADQAMPILKEVLKSRGECSRELRKQAVFLISQKMSDESVEILLDLAHRNPDPDPEVRQQAVFWLSQVHTDEAVDALQSILKESTDPAVQEKAIFAISQQGSDRAMQILKGYAERADAPTKLRENAIFWIGQNPKAGGTKYLMELYPRLSETELKEKAIFSIAQGSLPEGRQWLLARAKDRSESVDVRKNALFWAGQAGALKSTELKDLYGTLTEPEMKKQAIFVASQSKEKDAVDFLMDVARTEQDKDLRKTAVFWLGQSNDPRVPAFLLSLIKG